MPVGISIAMTNNDANKDMQTGIEDFAYAFAVMEQYATYITVNISCPNTGAGQPFLDPVACDALCTRLDTIETSKPIFLKLSPDIDNETLDAIVDCALRHRVSGIICTNLTKKHNTNTDVGGLSGKVVRDTSDAMIAHVYRRAGQQLTIVGCGGIFTAQDAYRKIKHGASLVQLITGMIFEGPQVVSSITQGLARLAAADGYQHIGQAVGADVVK